MAALGFALDLTRRAPAAGMGAALDPFAGQLYAAYGLQRLLSAYAGACLRARRSSDGAEADIGFTRRGAADAAALLAFAGAGSAFLVSWYDQTGNGRTAVQATGAAQPRIVNAGVLDVGPNGRPALVFSGAQFLLLAGAAGFARAAEAITVGIAGLSSGGTAPFFACQRGALVGWYRAAMFHTASVGATARFGTSGDDRANPAFAQRSYVAGTSARFIGRGRYLDGSVDFAIDGAMTTASIGTTTPSVDSDSAEIALGRAPDPIYLSGRLSAAVLSRAALDIPALDAALQGVLP